jgi:replication factor C small subunit
MASNFANLIWVEKYRPTHVKDIVMPDAFKKYFTDMIASGSSNNLLLCSPTAGTGKTTLAKAIVNDLGADCLYLNASSDNGISVAREQIAVFAATRSLQNKPKIVVLDEADGLTPALQAALRGYIEEFAKSCRFILTCNYISKIIEPLREGRTQVFDFNMSKAEFRKELTDKMLVRLKGILTHENVEFDEEVLPTIVNSCYPSMRKMITLLQKYAAMYGKIDTGILEFKAVSSDFDDLVKAKKLTDARNYINSNGFSPTDIFRHLFDEYIPKMDAKYRAQAIMILGQWEPQCAISTMPDLIVACALLDIMNLEV